VGGGNAGGGVTGLFGIGDDDRDGGVEVESCGGGDDARSSRTPVREDVEVVASRRWMRFEKKPERRLDPRVCQM
jgi:hypothetical protein